MSPTPPPWPLPRRTSSADSEDQRPADVFEDGDAATVGAVPAMWTPPENGGVHEGAVPVPTRKKQLTFDWDEPLIEFDTACELLGCCRATLLNLLRVGKLPGLKVGRSWIIPKRAFVDSLDVFALEQAAERAAMADMIRQAGVFSPPLPVVPVRGEKRGRGRPRKYPRSA